jgi:hypothetical protein
VYTLSQLHALISDSCERFSQCWCCLLIKLLLSSASISSAPQHSSIIGRIFGCCCCYCCCWRRPFAELRLFRVSWIQKGTCSDNVSKLLPHSKTVVKKLCQCHYQIKTYSTHLILIGKNRRSAPRGIEWLQIYELWRSNFNFKRKPTSYITVI